MRIFRNAEKDELPVLVEIINQSIRGGKANAYTEEFTLESRTPWFQGFEDDNHHLFVAEEEGTVLGYSSLVPYRCGRKALQATSEISFYIHENHHRMGVGTFLIEQTLAKCPELKVKNLLAILMDVNIASRNLLEKTGFDQWGHFPMIFDSGKVQCGQWVYGKNLR